VLVKENQFLKFPSLSLPPGQDVEERSPASLAGLQAYHDYIVGADQVLQEVRQMSINRPNVHMEANGYKAIK